VPPEIDDLLDRLFADASTAPVVLRWLDDLVGTP
jgi:hypothetical protein